MSSADHNNKLDPSHRVSLTLKNAAGVPTRIVHGTPEKMDQTLNDSFERRQMSIKEYSVVSQ